MAKVNVKLPEGTTCGSFVRGEGFSRKCPFFSEGSCTRFNQEPTSQFFSFVRTWSGTSWDGDYTSSEKVEGYTYYKLKKCDGGKALAELKRREEQKEQEQKELEMKQNLLQKEEEAKKLIAKKKRDARIKKLKSKLDLSDKDLSLLKELLAEKE